MTASLDRPRLTQADNSGIAVVPLEGGLGADILGFDFDALAPEQVAVMRAAWLEHGVIRFRGYTICDEQQVRFTSMLGEFVLHPRQMRGEEGAHPAYEQILIIGNARRDGKVVGTMANSEAEWHSDTFIYERPPAAAILRAIQLPKSGGDTYFASMYKIYAALPGAVRRAIDGRLIQLDLVYDGLGRLRGGQTVPATDDIRHWPHIRHPIVRTHGESRKNCLYIGTDKKGTWIVGLPLDESAAVLSEIMTHVRRPEFQLKQVWQHGDMIMWDNRCTMHRRDGWSADEVRIMHRTTTAGERPIYVC